MSLLLLSTLAVLSCSPRTSENFEGATRALEPRTGEDSEGATRAVRPRVEVSSDEAKGSVAPPEPSDAQSCEAERIPEGMRSEFSCRTDSDCVECACAPVNRVEWERRGGPKACNIAGEECIATNPACCAGRCVLAR